MSPTLILELKESRVFRVKTLVITLKTHPLTRGKCRLDMWAADWTIVDMDTSKVVQAGGHGDTGRKLSNFVVNVVIVVLESLVQITAEWCVGTGSHISRSDER